MYFTFRPELRGMAGPHTPRSKRGRWHRLVERYTPDGTIGRLVLALVAGSAGALSFSLAVYSFLSVGLVWLVAGLAATGVGLAASVLTILVLWPVYLSLIGNAESPAAYAEEVLTGSAGSPDDPLEVLKRQYASGNVSDEEFERRLDALLDAEQRSGSGQVSTSDQRDTAETLRETERT
jgi:uncharacterized membrane protein